MILPLFFWQSKYTAGATLLASSAIWTLHKATAQFPLTAYSLEIQTIQLHVLF